MVDNEPVIFDVMDSSSASAMSAANFDVVGHACDVLLLVYSIIDRQSFNYIRNLLRHLAQIKGKLNYQSI